MFHRVDLTAFSQGIWDARDAKEIPQEFADLVCQAAANISYPNVVGRSVCDYDKLLIALAGVKTDHWVNLVFLWKYLGPSLSSGISVANN